MTNVLRMKALIYSLICLMPLLLGTSSSRPEQGQQPPRRPNILLIVADDLGYGELGAYGQTFVETPHIDALARDGLRFTQFYSGSAVCAPARSVLLTGQHSGRTHIRGNDEWGERGEVWNYAKGAQDP